MNLQETIGSINPNINVTLAVIAAVIFGGSGFLVGRSKGHRDAIPEVHVALDRAARDVRLFAAKGIQGVAYGPSHQAVLREAEQIVRWRSYGANYLMRPAGVSRMRPPDEPRSVTKRREREADRRRNEIYFWGHNSKNADDTYAGPVNRTVHRRYE